MSCKFKKNWIAVFALGHICLCSFAQQQKSKQAYGMYHNALDMWVQRLENKERDRYQQPEKILDYMGNVNGKTIYDLGASTGYFSVRFAKKGARVIAADTEPAFLGYLRKRLPDEKLDTFAVEPRITPFDTPGIRKNEADIFFIANTYHHLDNKKEYLKTVYQGIKKNGELIIVAFFKRKEITIGPSFDMKQSEDEISKELTDAGFTIREINSTLLPLQFIIRARK
jgi:ubiquinone/menaquinone biosynthesis C-methylase UbiE